MSAFVHTITPSASFTRNVAQKDARRPSFTSSFVNHAARSAHVVAATRSPTTSTISAPRMQDMDHGSDEDERKLFVGNLSWSTTGDSLSAAFEEFGQVLSAKVIVNRDTGRSRGFGFVEFEEASSAITALEEMNGCEIDGREVRVSKIEKKDPRPRYNPVY